MHSYDCECRSVLTYMHLLLIFVWLLCILLQMFSLFAFNFMADWGLLEHDLFHLLIIQKCFTHGCGRGELEWENVFTMCLSKYNVYNVYKIKF